MSTPYSNRNSYILNSSSKSKEVDWNEEVYSIRGNRGCAKTLYYAVAKICYRDRVKQEYK